MIKLINLIFFKNLFFMLISNNKSINNCLINDNEINSDIAKVDFDDKKLISNNVEPFKFNKNNSPNSVKQIVIKNIIKTNKKGIPKKSNEKEQNSNENFVKGHRFQIKYEKVKSKSQMYKEVIPKKRNFSMNKIDFKVDENIIINNLNNRSFIDYSSSPKNNNTNNNNI